MIEFFTDGIRLWNLGDRFGDDSHLLEPCEEAVRNPAIVVALRCEWQTLAQLGGRASKCGSGQLWHRLTACYSGW